MSSKESLDSMLSDLEILSDSSDTCESLFLVEKREKEEKAKEISTEKQPMEFNKELLRTKIRLCEETLKEVQANQKMKNVTQANLLLAVTLQRIVGQQSNNLKPVAAGKKDYTKKQQICIKNLLKRKRDLTKEIRQKQQEIVELQNTPFVQVEDNERPSDKSQSNDCSDTSDIKEIYECSNLLTLREKSKHLHHRTKMLSSVLKSLVVSSELPSQRQLVEVCKDIRGGSCHTLAGVEETLEKLKKADAEQFSKA